MSDGMDVWEVPDAKAAGERERRLQALEWLLKQLRGTNLRMDGTCDWSLPHNVLSGIRAPTALDAILEAKRRYDHWCDHDAPSKDRS
jgi:hypothetical protein